MNYFSACFAYYSTKSNNFLHEMHRFSHMRDQNRRIQNERWRAIDFSPALAFLPKSMRELFIYSHLCLLLTETYIEQKQNRSHQTPRAMIWPTYSLTKVFRLPHRSYFSSVICLKVSEKGHNRLCCSLKKKEKSKNISCWKTSWRSRLQAQCWLVYIPTWCPTQDISFDTTNQF